MVCCLSFLMVGCGKSSAKEKFEAYFMDFCDDVAEIDTEIKEIDPDAEEAPAKLLESLDKLNKLFEEMSTTTFPQEYDYLVTLAEEAGSYMNLAVENYHTAFESPVFDEESANLASEYYSRSYKRIKYMLTFMHGEVPDSSEITYTSAESGESNESGE